MDFEDLKKQQLSLKLSEVEIREKVDNIHANFHQNVDGQLPLTVDFNCKKCKKHRGSP